MSFLDWLTGAPPDYRSPLLQAKARPPTMNPGGAALTTNTVLVHGPGATDLLVGERGDGNSAVFACLRVLSQGYIEPALRLYQEAPDGQLDPWTGTSAAALRRLLRRPNPFLPAKALLAYICWCTSIDGNAFLVKERASRRGQPVALWPLSPKRIEIRSEGRFITAYRHHYTAGKYQDFSPEDILHFRFGIDDRDPRYGLAPIKRLVREIRTDHAVGDWLDALLGNYAMPGLVLSLPPDTPLTEEQATQLQERMQGIYGAGRRGRIGVVAGGATLSSVGFNPEQMKVDILSDQSEERISGVLGVPAILAGLGAGLDAATYNNSGQLRQHFTETTLVPRWTTDAEVWTDGLVPEFTSADDIVCRHDLSDVRALQEDEDAKYERLARGVVGGFLTINEARSDVGLAPLIPERGDVLLLPNNATVTPLTPPEPEPPPEEEEDTDGALAIPAAFRNLALPPPASKQGDEITAADLAAARRRARDLGLLGFWDATVHGGNGHE
jgi:HK97 family phage portal protein